MRKTITSSAKWNARIPATKIGWLFFGIHTAKALHIGKRMAKVKQQAEPPQRELRLVA